MKFRKSGVHDPNALDLLRKVQPITFAKQSPWNRLNFLLGLVNKHKPEDRQEYVANLQRRYEDLVSSDLVEENSINFSTHLSEFDSLREFPDLASSNLNYFFHNLKPPVGIDYEKDIIEVPQRNQLRAVLCPKYQNIFVLAKTIGRAEAIDLYKLYHDEFMRAGHSSQENRYETLNEFADRWFQADTKEAPGLVRIISEVKDGKLFLRKDTCLWSDAIQDLEDQELKYYICCYGDFESAIQANKHFVLTMERTIIEGHPYCDSVFHDKRISKDISHPSDEFFARMETD